MPGKERLRWPLVRLIALLDGMDLALEDGDQEIAVTGCRLKKVLSTKSGPVSSSDLTRSSI